MWGFQGVGEAQHEVAEGAHQNLTLDNSATAAPGEGVELHRQF